MQAIRRSAAMSFSTYALAPALQRPRDVLVGVVGRQDDDLGLRIALANLPHRLDAFHHRHPQIEQRDVGTMALEGGDRLDAVRGLGDDDAGPAPG